MAKYDYSERYGKFYSILLDLYKGEYLYELDCMVHNYSQLLNTAEGYFFRPVGLCMFSRFI